MIKENNKTAVEIYSENKSVEYIYEGDKLVFERIFTNKRKPGFIAFYDTIKERYKIAKREKLNKINLERYVPIGILVDNNNTIVSLTLMSCDTPAIGDIIHDRNNTAMYYGPSMTIADIPNCKTEAEALADFDGYNHTKALISKRGSKNYNNWTPSNLSYFDYPASSCCDIFYTIGTQQTSWYLPACGELNYLHTNFNEIENSFIELINLGIRVTNIDEDRYWSSSDYGGLYAWNMIPKTGSINYNNKQTNNYKVRAFNKLDI